MKRRFITPYLYTGGLSAILPILITLCSLRSYGQGAGQPELSQQPPGDPLAGQQYPQPERWHQPE